jgi:DNA-binding NtrC family response regulator
MTELGRILVVDDTPAVREVLRDFFVELGYAVELAADGVDALAALPLFHPDVVLLDLKMPEMDGEDVFAALRLLDEHLPVIIITASADVELARHLLRQGAFDFVPKPFYFSYLEDVVGAAVSARASATASA